MRIRQVKPAFWSDAKLASLPEGTRLFYIGLWMVADDAGWLRWDPAEVARDLYGYQERRSREKRVASMFEQLRAAGRVVLHECGHVEVPKLSDHQHLAGSTKQVRTTFNEHLRGCVSPSRADPQEPAGNREPPHRLGNGNGKVRSVKVSEGIKRASARGGEPSEFDRAMAASGLDPKVVGK